MRIESIIGFGGQKGLGFMARGTKSELVQTPWTLKGKGVGGSLSWGDVMQA